MHVCVCWCVFVLVYGWPSAKAAYITVGRSRAQTPAVSYLRLFEIGILVAWRRHYGYSARTDRLVSVYCDQSEHTLSDPHIPLCGSAFHMLKVALK